MINIVFLLFTAHTRQRLVSQKLRRERRKTRKGDAGDEGERDDYINLFLLNVEPTKGKEKERERERRILIPKATLSENLESKEVFARFVRVSLRCVAQISRVKKEKRVRRQLRYAIHLRRVHCVGADFAIIDIPICHYW